MPPTYCLIGASGFYLSEPLFLICKAGRGQHWAVVNSTDLGARLLEFESYLCHSSCAIHISWLKTRDNNSV